MFPDIKGLRRFTTQESSWETLLEDILEHKNKCTQEYTMNMVSKGEYMSSSPKICYYINKEAKQKPHNMGLITSQYLVSSSFLVIKPQVMCSPKSTHFSTSFWPKRQKSQYHMRLLEGVCAEIEFVTTLLLFYVLDFYGHKACESSFLTRD